MEHDSYYKDQSSLTYEQRCKTNYDHPFAFDTDLFVDHIKELKKGNSIQKPIYDYSIHNRKKETVTVEPKEIIIVEGLLISVSYTHLDVYKRQVLPSLHPGQG